MCDHNNKNNLMNEKSKMVEMLPFKTCISDACAETRVWSPVTVPSNEVCLAKKKNF